MITSDAIKAARNALRKGVGVYAYDLPSTCGGHEITDIAGAPIRSGRCIVVLKDTGKTVLLSRKGLLKDASGREF